MRSTYSNYFSLLRSCRTKSVGFYLVAGGIFRDLTTLSYGMALGADFGFRVKNSSYSKSERWHSIDRKKGYNV